MPEPVDLILVSGFLGAGKTTFMRSLIPLFPPEKLGVLVNEFGSIGIDGALVKKEGLRLVEINDGSVFCACLKDGFVRTLKAFAQQPINTLLIECSGMADPASMQTLLSGLAPYLERPYRYLGCVCIVDATTFLRLVDILMPIQNQVATADLIIVNKTDLATTESLEEIHRFLRILNEDAPVFNTIYAALPEATLKEQLKNRGKSGKSSNTPASRPATYTCTAEGTFEKEELEAFCEETAPFVLRMKGFLRAPHGWWHLEAVAGNYTVSPAETELEPAALPTAGRLVLIAADGRDISAYLTAAWHQHCKSEMQLVAT